jgi:hypothetical protein
MLHRFGMNYRSRLRRMVRMFFWSRLIAILISLGAWLILATCQKAFADGGTIRISEKRGDYRISAFTTPNPFRAGPVEISVLVQDAATGERSSDVNVSLLVAAHQRPGEIRRYPASTDAATNKLFQSSTFELPAAGSWDFEVNVEGAHSAAKVNFDMEAADRLPRWLSMWPWFSWPFLVVLLFAAHQAFAVNPTRFRPMPAPRRSPQPRHE